MARRGRGTGARGLLPLVGVSLEKRACILADDTLGGWGVVSSQPSTLPRLPEDVSSRRGGLEGKAYGDLTWRNVPFLLVLKPRAPEVGSHPSNRKSTYCSLLSVLPELPARKE